MYNIPAIYYLHICLPNNSDTLLHIFSLCIYEGIPIYYVHDSVQGCRTLNRIMLTIEINNFIIWCMTRCYGCGNWCFRLALNYDFVLIVAEYMKKMGVQQTGDVTFG